ncbi:hypothetical protein Tco_0601991 [Tanacetum coccineum]
MSNTLNSELVEPLPEPERTLNRRLRRQNRRVPYDQRNSPPQHPRIVYPSILNINYFRHFLDILRNYYPIDDEPMWAVDHVVALTPGSANTILETANEFAIKGNHLTLVKGNQFDGRTKTDPHKHIHEFLEICDMFKYRDTENEAVRLMIFPPITHWKCSETAMVITFPKAILSKKNYHGLSEITQEVLNAAAGETKSSLKKTIALADKGNSNTNTDKIMARMDAMTINMDAQYKELQSRAKQPTPDLDDDDMPMSLEEEAKFLQTFLAKNHQASIQNLENKFDRLVDKQFGRPSGSLPINTQPNPQGSKAYQPPQARNEHVNVVFTRSGKSYNPPDNPDDQQNNYENPINFDSDDEDDEPTPQPKTQPTKLVTFTQTIQTKDSISSTL